MQRVESLAALSEGYQGKDRGEQEYQLAIALVQADEQTPIPDLGVKDSWLRVRDGLVEKIIEQRVAVEATAVTAAGQVLVWADSGGRGSFIYDIPMAILTAMIVDSVIDAMGGDGKDGNRDSKN
jgi:hypothetical protein